MRSNWRVVTRGDEVKGDAHPPPRAVKCSAVVCYTSVMARIATVSRIATSASALLEKSKFRMVSVLSILLDGTRRVKVYRVTFVS
jgi:hypothetical protein